MIEIGTTKIYLKHPLTIDGTEVTELVVRDGAHRAEHGAESVVLTQRKKSKVEGKKGDLVYKDKANPGEQFPLDESFEGLTYTTESGDRFRIDKRELSLTPPTAPPETPAIAPEPVPKREVISVVGVSGRGREAARLAGESMDRTKDLWKKTFQEYFEERRRQFYARALEAAQTPFAEEAITKATELAKQQWKEKLDGMNRVKRSGARLWNSIVDHLGGRTQEDELTIKILAEQRDALVGDAAKAFDREKDALAQRFESEFDREDSIVRQQMGEGMVVFKPGSPDRPEHGQIASDIKTIINAYRTDTSADADKTLQQKLHEFYGRTLKTYAPELVIEADQYASSLTAIAKEQKTRLAHGEGTANLDAELDQMEIRLAVGHMGTATELTPTDTVKWVGRVRKVWETLQKKNIVTAAVFNDTTVSTGVSLFLAISKLPVRSVASWKARMLIGPAAGAGIGALMGGMREYRRRQLDLRRYWAQREANVVSPEDARMRAWYERFDLKPRAVDDLVAKMTTGLYAGDGKTLKDSLTIDQLRTSVAELSDARARWDLSSREKNRVGLINIGTIGEQEANRTALSQTMVRVERDLKKYCADHAGNAEVVALLGGQTFDAFREGMVKIQTSVLEKGRKVLDDMTGDSAMRLALNPLSGYSPEVEVFRRRLGIIGTERKTDRKVQGLDAVMAEFRKEAFVESVRKGAWRGAIGFGIGAVVNEAVVDVRDLAQFHTLTGTGAIASGARGLYEGFGKLAFHKDWSQFNSSLVGIQNVNDHMVMTAPGMHIDDRGNLDITVGNKVIQNVIPSFKDHVTFTEQGMQLDAFAKQHLEQAGYSHMITQSELMPASVTGEVIKIGVRHAVTIGKDTYMVPESLHVVTNPDGTGKLVYDMVDEVHRKIPVTIADHIKMTNGAMDASVLKTLEHRTDLFHVTEATHETVKSAVPGIETHTGGAETAAPAGVRELHFMPGADANNPAGIGDRGTWAWFEDRTASEQFNHPTAAYDAMLKLERSWLLHQADPNKDITFDKIPGMETVTRAIPFHTTPQGNEVWLNALPGNTVLHLPNSLFSDQSMAHIGHLSDRAITMYQQKIAEGGMTPVEALNWVDKQDHALGILLKAGYFGREQDMPNNDELLYLMQHLGGAGTGTGVGETVAPRVVENVITTAGRVNEAYDGGTLNMAFVSVSRDPAGYIPIIPVYPPPRRLEAVSQPLAPFTETVAATTPTPAPELGPAIAPYRLPRRRARGPVIEPVVAPTPEPTLPVEQLTVRYETTYGFPHADAVRLATLDNQLDVATANKQPQEEMRLLNEMRTVSEAAGAGITNATQRHSIDQLDTVIRDRMKTLHEAGTAYPAGYAEPEVPNVEEAAAFTIERSDTGQNLFDAYQSVLPLLADQPEVSGTIAGQIDSIVKGTRPQDEMTFLNNIVNAHKDVLLTNDPDVDTFNKRFMNRVHRRMAVLQSRGIPYPDGYTAPAPESIPVEAIPATEATPGRSPLSMELERRMSEISRILSDEDRNEINALLPTLTTDKSIEEQVAVMETLANKFKALADAAGKGAKQDRLDLLDGRLRNEISVIKGEEVAHTPMSQEIWWRMNTGFDQGMTPEQFEDIKAILGRINTNRTNDEQAAMWEEVAGKFHTMGESWDNGGRKDRMAQAEQLVRGEITRLQTGGQQPVETEAIHGPFRTALSQEIEGKMFDERQGFEREFTAAEQQEIKDLLADVVNGMPLAEQAQKMQDVYDRIHAKSQALPEDNRRRARMEKAEERLQLGIRSLMDSAGITELPKPEKTDVFSDTAPRPARLKEDLRALMDTNMSDALRFTFNDILSRYPDDLTASQERDFLNNVRRALEVRMAQELKAGHTDEVNRIGIVRAITNPAHPAYREKMLTPVSAEAAKQPAETQPPAEPMPEKTSFAKRMEKELADRNGGDLGDSAAAQLRELLVEYTTDLSPGDELNLLGRIFMLANAEVVRTEHPSTLGQEIMRAVETRARKLTEEHPEIAANRIEMKKVKEATVNTQGETPKATFYEKLEKRITGKKMIFAPGDKEKILELVRGLPNPDPQQEMEAITKASEAIEAMRMAAPENVDKDAYVKTTATLTTRWEQLASGSTQPPVEEAPVSTQTPVITQTPVPTPVAASSTTAPPTPTETSTPGTVRNAKDFMKATYSGNQPSLPKEQNTRLKTWTKKFKQDTTPAQELALLDEGKQMLDEFAPTVADKVNLKNLVDRLQSAITARRAELTGAPAENIATPTETPTAAPTTLPMETPTITPNETPTVAPTETPTAAPTDTLTPTPTETPTTAPTEAPNVIPTETPTPTQVADSTQQQDELGTIAPVFEVPAPTPTENPLASQESTVALHDTLAADITAATHIRPRLQERLGDMLKELTVDATEDIRLMTAQSVRRSVQTEIDELLEQVPETDDRIVELKKIRDEIDAVVPPKE